jgi:CBS domain-containing protein
MTSRSKTNLQADKAPPTTPQENGCDGLLPHERAQVPANAAEHRPDPLIEQAHRDIERGLVDTDMRATPGLDADRRQQLLRRSSRQSSEVARQSLPEGGGDPQTESSAPESASGGSVDERVRSGAQRPASKAGYPTPLQRSHMMKRVADVMTEEVQVIEPQQSLKRAAEIMAKLDVGSLPVCNGSRLLGMLTDRDIVVRGIASGLDLETDCVSAAMTEGVLYCAPGQDIAEALQLMGNEQVRRLPVIDAERRLVGIVSLGDLAVERPQDAGTTVSEISHKDSAHRRI